MVAPFQSEAHRTAGLEELTDADLILQFKQGNDGALEVLLRRHHDALYRFSFHLVGNQEDAEDITQESLARAIAHVDTLQQSSSFRSWLFRIARNLSMDAFRSGRRTVALPDEEITPLPLHVDGPHDHVELGEEHQTIAEALSKLTTSHQRVLWMREVEGLSYADIAQRLDVSHSAVETLLFRARRRLREEYTKRDRPVAGLAALVGLKRLFHRFIQPIGSAPLGAKAAVTAAVVAGTVVTAPHIIPVGNASAVQGYHIATHNAGSHTAHGMVTLPVRYPGAAPHVVALTHRSRTAPHAITRRSVVHRLTSQWATRHSRAGTGRAAAGNTAPRHALSSVNWRPVGSVGSSSVAPFSHASRSPHGRSVSYPAIGAPKPAHAGRASSYGVAARRTSRRAVKRLRSQSVGGPVRVNRRGVARRSTKTLIHHPAVPVQHDVVGTRHGSGNRAAANAQTQPPAASVQASPAPTAQPQAPTGNAAQANAPAASKANGHSAVQARNTAVASAAPQAVSTAISHP